MGGDLEEIYVNGEEVYSGKLLKIQRDLVRLPDGKEAFREYVKHPGASVILAEKSPGVFIFERQHRYPLHRDFIELPAGKIDASDTPLMCAQRELQEETGYTAEEWRHLGTLHPCIGYSNECIEIFLARGLHPGTQPLDAGEFLEVFEMSLSDAEGAVLTGNITDGKTIAGLFWARKLIG